MAEPTVREELQRRKSKTDEMMQFFRTKPLQWIGAVDLEPVGGRQAWRSRVSEARQRFEQADEGTITNRQTRAVVQEADGRTHVRGPILSEYMFTPYRPLGPDAAEPRRQKSLW